ncbi:MAG TPA: tetratricopeptide repeat protein [Streptosporangiaceae bacterium]|nr:tetratricopeptide repeat protein [Streptosporangiaceae bacterium]
MPRRPEPAGQPVRLAPRPPLLAGREQLLAELDARLLAGAGRGPRMVALCGLGGAGKTSVAVEYAHRYLAEVGLAWQFPAEDASVLGAGFGELAAQLGARDLVDTRDPVASVHAVLAAYPQEWLLLFDNAPDRESVAAYLPPAGSGRVLITSQNPSWPPGQALDVPVLDVEVAASFLVNRAGDPDQHAATELATELGGLPLALEQAAAYIQASGGTLAAYLRLFRQRRDAMLARGEPTGYGKTVATTWSLAFERLEQSAPAAVGLLRLLACYAPEAIPLSLLLQPRPGLSEHLGAEVAAVLMPLLDDPLAASDAIAALRRYSLVIPAGAGSISVHRLVQAVTADQMAAELAGQWRQAAAALLEAAIPADTDVPEGWPACAALLPHAEAALADESPGMAGLANYLGVTGSYATALELQQRVLSAQERVLGPEHPDTLATRHNLASWTGLAGDAAGARDQLAEVLPIQERVLGPEHPATLATWHNLAYWTGQAGDVAGARDQFAKLLPIRERVLGPEHPATLATWHNLAYWTGQAGDVAEARDQFAKLLPIFEQVLGPEHPETIAARNNLAYWCRQAGRGAR